MMRIVVVEDEDLFRKELVLMTPWEDLGCTVVGEADNGTEGLEIIRRLRPDIVVTDIRMPGLDGIAMISSLERALSENERPEYVIISGYDDFRYAQSAIRYGVKEYILKPVDDGEFRTVLEKIVSGLKLRKERKKIDSNLDKIPDSRLMLFREYLSNDDTSTKENYVNNAIRYIAEHYRENISIGDASEHLRISESYLSRLFRSETSFTFLEYLTNFRLKKAIGLLRDKSVKIYEVADLVGYRDPRYFSNIFRKYVGVTPLQFKDGMNVR